MPKPAIALVVAEPEEKESRKKKLTLPIPEGLDLEGNEDGDMLETVAEFKIEKGKLCLKKINGIDVYDPNDEAKPGPRDFAGAVTGETEDY